MDALMSPWPQGFWYALPPIPLLPRVLTRLRDRKSLLILVVLGWPRRTWVSMGQRLAQFPLLHLQVLRDMLLQGNYSYEKGKRGAGREAWQ